MKCTLLFLILILAGGRAVSGAETGTPLMTAYSCKETGGHPQHWDIIQDDRGVMYIGNGTGVQEFDGSTWRMILLTNRSFARSFAKDRDGRIYVGGGGEIGFLEPDLSGRMQFVSLLNRVEEKDRNFTGVLCTRSTPEGIYFLSQEKLFRFQARKDPADQEGRTSAWTVKTWQPPSTFRSLFWVDGTLYVQQSGSGLMKMQNDSLVKVPGSELFAEQRMPFLLPYPGRPDTYLAAGVMNGLFLWHNGVFSPFRTEVDESLHKGLLTSGFWLPDGCLAVGTAAKGIFILDPAGVVRLHLTQNSGLVSNGVTALYLDRQKNLWGAGDGGTTIVEYNSSLSQFTSPSFPSTFIRFKDVFYIGSNGGLFSLEPNAQFKLLAGTSEMAQSFQFLQIKQELFVTTGLGICQVDDRKARLVLPTTKDNVAFTALFHSRTIGEDILAGAGNGACVLRYDPTHPNRLTLKERIQGLHEYIYTVAEPEPGTFWLGTFDEGTIRLRKKGSDFRDANIDRFGTAHNLPAGSVFTYLVSGRLCFTTMQGVYRFDESRKKFEPDPLFAGIGLGANPAEGILAGDAAGNIWVNLGRETALLKKMPDGGFRLDKQVLSRFGEDTVFSIYAEPNHTVWFGTLNHVFRYIPQASPQAVPPNPTLLRRIALADGAPVFSGSRFPLFPDQWDLPYSSNELHFEFALPSYLNSKANEFQSKLEGFDTRFSEWSRETKRYYTNLPAGSYRFLVRARNISGQESAPADFAFTIRSPWYRTWIAYAAYVVGVLMLFLGVVRLRTRRLQEKSEALERTVRERTAEIQAQKENIEQLSIIGRNITDKLSSKDIIDTVYENVNKLMDASVFGIGLHSPETQALIFPATREKGQSLEEFSVPLRDENRLAVWCFRNREEVFINDYRRDFSRYIHQILPAVAGENPESILYLPLQHKDRVIGVITAQSFLKNSYTEYHRNILRNLATYSAIALENAEAFGKVNQLLQDLQATQQKLITQSKLAALGALTAGIAHEIKNPLNFVNNFAALLQKFLRELERELERDSPDRNAIREILKILDQNAEKIGEHGKRADSIVRSMLQHSRGKSGDRQETDLNALLAEDVQLAYHGMRAQDSRFNIAIETDFDPGIGKIKVVPQEISRVFLNIISNACYEADRKKSAAGAGFTPRLQVRSRSLGDRVEIRIRDNGDGVPASIRDKLFTPFFTTKPTGQGTGLGLSISYDIIVHQHHGQLFFESEEGSYTEFIIQLPVK